MQIKRYILRLDSLQWLVVKNCSKMQRQLASFSNFLDLCIRSRANNQD